MSNQLSLPLHFAAEFLTLVVCLGAAFQSIRARWARTGSMVVAQAAGFIALAVAEALHLSLVATSDASPLLLVVRTIGFGLLAVGARPSMSGAPLVFAAGRNGSWAMVPAAAAAVVAARGFAEYRRERAAGALGFAAAFVAFAASEAATAVAAPAGGPWLAAGHALRALAALLLASWLWSSVVRSIRLRFVAAFIAGLVILVLVVSTSQSVVLTNNLQREELDRVSLAAASEIQSLGPLESRAVTAANGLASLTGLATDVRSGAKSTLQRFSEEALRQVYNDVDLLLIVDGRGRALAAADRVPGTARVATMPRTVVDPLAGSDLVAASLARRRGVTIDTAGPGLVVVLAAQPVLNGNTVVGAVAIGYRLDHDYLLQVVRHSGAEATMLVGGEVAATTGDATAASRALARGSVAARIRSTVLEGAQPLAITVPVGGAETFTAVVPLQRSSDLAPVAALVLSRPATAADKTQRDTNRVLFLVTLAAAAVASFVGWVLGGRITRPIRVLTDAAERVRRGDLEARIEPSSRDEVGRLGSTFNDMTTSIGRLTGNLRDAAEQEARLRVQMEAIMQSMGDGLIATDGSSRVVAFNRAAERILGIPAKRANGKPLADVLRGQARAGGSLLAMALNGGGEALIVRSGGGRVPVALTSAPLADPEGGRGGRVIVFRDVSSQVEAERMKSEFLSNVSHELRTPLTPIKGYAEILKRKTFPRTKTLTFLDGILESTGRLERIVEILVDFAAMEAGRLRPRTEPVDLRRFTADLVGRWQKRDAAHVFNMDVPAMLPRANADPKLLAKAVDELIDNAVKFSPSSNGSRRPKVLVEAAVAGRGNGRELALSVVDQGIGIPAEQVANLFEDFRQLDGSETRTYGGLGLGLSYAKRVMEVHNGGIEVASTPGKGSTFTIRLPVADGKGRKVATRTAAARSAPAAKKRRAGAVRAPVKARTKKGTKS